ncbi:MAG TPA: hypothetical protein VHB79_25470 [Polyangiaceae bacterium]|nr:hypothetical protein [Polyangiaceae bacterium]
MRLQLFQSFGFGALALGFIVGCEGGQTGDLSGQNGGGSPSVGETFGGCDEHQEELKGFDTETEAGTAEALLAYAEKSFDAPIAWQTASEGQSWSVGPEKGEGQLHVTVTRGTKAYRLTYTEPKSTNGLETGGISFCPAPSVGVAAHVDVTTDGGALAESFDTMLRSNLAGVATLSVPLDFSKLGGSLTSSSSNPHAKLVQPRLEAMLTASGTSGSIAAMEQTEDGEVAGASRALIAVWPGSAACADAQDGVGLEVAVDDEVLGTTGTETLAAVALDAPADITWMDDSKTKLSVVIESTGNGCFSLNDNVSIPSDRGPGASYPVRVTMKSDDGRVDGEYAGHAVVRGVGDQRRIEVQAEVEVDMAHSADSGFRNVSAPAGSESLIVSFKTYKSQASASGSVDLFATASPPCAAEAPPPMSTPGQGASAPGCEGSSETRLENASWEL